MKKPLVFANLDNPKEKFLVFRNGDLRPVPAWVADLLLFMRLAQ